MSQSYFEKKIPIFIKKIKQKKIIIFILLIIVGILFDINSLVSLKIQNNFCDKYNNNELYKYIKNNITSSKLLFVEDQSLFNDNFCLRHNLHKNLFFTEFGRNHGVFDRSYMVEHKKRAKINFNPYENLQLLQKKYQVDFLLLNKKIFDPAWQLIFNTEKNFLYKQESH